VANDLLIISFFKVFKYLLLRKKSSPVILEALAELETSSDIN
jgi:hypothetical protein